jgi:hypothetical protein
VLNMSTAEDVTNNVKGSLGMLWHPRQGTTGIFYGGVQLLPTSEEPVDHQTRDPARRQGEWVINNVHQRHHGELRRCLAFIEPR